MIDLDGHGGGSVRPSTQEFHCTNLALYPWDIAMKTYNLSTP